MMWRTDRPPLDQVFEIIERRFAHPLVIDDVADRAYSYGEIHALACALADQIRAHGVGPGDRLALLLPNSAEFVAMYLACLYLGTIVVPISPTLSKPDIAFILENAGLSGVAIASSLTESFPPPAGLRTWQVSIPAAVDCGGRDRLSAAAWPARSNDDLFSITFTSGTTERPKGVPHRVGSLMSAASAFNAAVGFDHSMRMVHVLPMAYMAGFLNTLLGPFVAEGTVILARPFDNVALLKFWEPLIRRGANAIWMTPTIAAALLRFDRGSAGTAFTRHNALTICCGTAPLPKPVQDEFEARYAARLLQSYGLSELLFISTQQASDPAGKSSVGHPLPGVEIEVRDEAGQPVASGDGELFVKTPFLMEGYLDFSTGSPASLSRNHWFPTGDVGHIDADGECIITGRKKDLIIRGGTNVSPRAVEEVLLKHPAVAEVAVVGVPDPIYGERIVAALVMADGHALETERRAILAHCQNHLSGVAQPSELIAFDAFPASITGKVQKHAIRSYVTSRPGGAA